MRLKLSDKTVKLLQTIRASVGDTEFTAAELMAKCTARARGEYPMLGALVTAAQFNTKRLGHFLKKNQGAVIDGTFRLCSDRGRRTDGKGRQQRWLYRFEDITGLSEKALLELDALDGEARINVSRKPGTRRAVAESHRQVARAEKLADLTAPAPGPLTFVKISRTGKVTTEVVRDRNGDPVPAHPQAEPPAPAASPAPERSSKEWRQPTREELRARHEGHIPQRDGVATPGYADAGRGFFNPGGVVQQAITLEQSKHSPVRVCGHWPRNPG